MKTPSDRNLESDNIFGPCKDFLCPQESKLQEWFPDPLSARLRAKALDPYGLFKAKVVNGSMKSDDFNLVYKCQNEDCHVKFVLRKVKPDPEGNSYGLLGCNSHQHELPRFNRSELVFENKIEAENFYEENLKRMYLIAGSIKGKDYRKFICRRKNLQPGFGHHDCSSVFSITQTFAKVRAELIEGFL